MTRIPTLKRTAVTYKDVCEQEPADFFLIVDAGPMSGPLMFNVDGVEVGEFVNRAYLKRGFGKVEYIFDFSPHWPWYMPKLELTEALTHEEMMTRQKEDRDATKELYKKLYDGKEPEDPTNPLGSGMYL